MKDRRSPHPRLLLLIIPQILFFLLNCFAGHCQDSSESRHLQDQSIYFGNPVPHPEELSGIWEAPDRDGNIIRLHLRLSVSAPPETVTFAGTPLKWVALHATISLGKTDSASWGPSLGFTDSPNGGLRYENGRLTTHGPLANLDLQHSAHDSWLGRVHYGQLDAQVEFKRPGANLSKQSPFNGTWSREDTVQHQCLHIIQRAPNDFVGWLDSLTAMGMAMLPPQRSERPGSGGFYGEMVKVEVYNNRYLNITRNRGLCCSHSFLLHVSNTHMNRNELRRNRKNFQWEKLAKGSSCTAAN